MSSVPLMEWNAKHPLQWDLENLIMLNATPTENVKKLRATDWELGGEKGVDSGSFTSCRGGSGSGSGGSNSDLGFACFSKCSTSVSNNSSSIAEVKTSKYVEASECVSEDFNHEKEFVKAKTTDTSPNLEVSVGSGEPLLSLKLGKQTYFEDICAGNNAKASTISGTPISSESVTPVKRTRSSFQGTHAPRCQVEGCSLDLSSAKDYHRKHRVCVSHSKCPKVIVAGVERRFCQQCSRFHGLSEFDEKKRSCRRRLSDHNARRRKPQPVPVNLNPARLSSSLYSTGGRQSISFICNKSPLVNAVTNANLTWDGLSSSKFKLMEEYMVKPDKIGGIDGQVHLPHNSLSNSIPTDRPGYRGLLPSKDKGTASEVLNQGLEESIVSTCVDDAPDIHRALSLLSANSWGSCDPKSVALEQPMHTNNASMAPSMLLGMSQGFPLASSEYWRTNQQSTNTRVHTLTSRSDDNSYFQEFQLLRAPYESDFYSSHLS